MTFLKYLFTPLSILSPPSPHTFCACPSSTFTFSSSSSHPHPPHSVSIKSHSCFCSPLHTAYNYYLSSTCSTFFSSSLQHITHCVSSSLFLHPISPYKFRIARHVRSNIVRVQWTPYNYIKKWGCNALPLWKKWGCTCVPCSYPPVFVCGVWWLMIKCLD